MRLSYNNHAEMQTSKISGNQVPEHRSTTRKSVAEQTAATMKRQHCTPAPESSRSTTLMVLAYKARL